MFRFFDSTNERSLEQLEETNKKLDAFLNEVIKRNHLNIPLETDRSTRGKPVVDRVADDYKIAIPQAKLGASS